MQHPGANIKALRLQAGLTQKQLAEQTKLDQGWLSAIENGKGNPSSESMEALARALHVSIGVLWADRSMVDTAIHGVRRIPVLRLEQVAKWKGADDDDLDWNRTEPLFVGLKNCSRHAFAIRIADTENAPALDVGDDAIFDPGIEPWPGSMVVGTSSMGKVYIGRFREMESTDPVQRSFEIVPVNHFHPAHASNQRGGIELRGVMVEHRKYASKR